MGPDCHEPHLDLPWSGMVAAHETHGFARPRRALLSLADKSGLISLAKTLQTYDIEIISTGSTACYLRDANLPVVEVSSVTGMDEMLGGRVKTLHPAIHGGLLAREGEDDEEIRAHDIVPIDLVVVSLYDFQKGIANGVSIKEAIELIDIGGVALLRAGAKNFARVCVISDPGDYRHLVTELEMHDGAISPQARSFLAVKAFEHTSAYDHRIAAHLASRLGTRSGEDAFPEVIDGGFYRVQSLRYGENPHQKAALYLDRPLDGDALVEVMGHQYQGKPLSYNNLLDSDAAWCCARGLKNGALCVIVKHSSPCGVALGDDALGAYEAAFETDPVSAFGGVIAFNAAVDESCARTILDKQFAEVVIAEEFSAAALEVFAARPNLRIVRRRASESSARHWRSLEGGALLIQQTDISEWTPDAVRVVSKCTVDEAQWSDMHLAWHVVQFVRSNAIVLVANGRVIGIGAGQPSRVDSTRLAVEKARSRGFALQGAVLASDAFLPFADNVELAAQAGISAIIQPSGSIRDTEVIEACDQHGMALVFTTKRHFRH